MHMGKHEGAGCGEQEEEAHSGFSTEAASPLGRLAAIPPSPVCPIHVTRTTSKGSEKPGRKEQPPPYGEGWGGMLMEPQLVTRWGTGSLVQAGGGQGPGLCFFDGQLCERDGATLISVPAPVPYALHPATEEKVLVWVGHKLPATLPGLRQPPPCSCPSLV